MNKSFLLSALTGTITYFLLGWLFYGILFPDLYLPYEQCQTSLVFIFLGGLFYVSIFSLVYTRWATISTFGTGALTGLVLGFLYSVSMNFYMFSSKTLDIEHFITDVFAATISAAVMGGVAGLTIGKSS
ncbi:MAG: hypothetical protein VX344_00965 [Bacteroidota bacterium]|nr:hypothetical protein [Bacteroidota bacterium]